MKTLTEHEKGILENCVNKTFRNIADQEYISARLLYKSKLFLQLLWMAAQSIEKYLKAILIYNEISVTQSNHHEHSDLYKMIIDSIKDIKFDFPDDVINFIKYLDEQGQNRYFSTPYVIQTNFLTQLDKTVWYIRRYCDNYRKTENGKSIFKEEIKRIQHQNLIDHPNQFKLYKGYLEQVMEDEIYEHRKILIWKNSYYYKKYRRLNISDDNNEIIEIPPIDIDPDHFDLISKYIFFPRTIKPHFQKYNGKKCAPIITPL